MAARLVLITILCGLCGCRFAFTPIVAPTVDTTGAVGFETRLEMSLAIGEEDARYHMTAATGYGYSAIDDHHLQQTVGAGAEFGNYTKADDLPILAHAVAGFTFRGAPGGFLMLDLLGRLAQSRRFEQYFFLGPRLETSVVYRDPEDPDVDPRAGGVRGVFSLGLAFHAVLFGLNFFEPRRPKMRTTPTPPPQGDAQP
jgi:hypothetical protein